MKLINILFLCIALVTIIDFCESFYYLEKYGYHLELNPLVTNRHELIIAMLIRILTTLSCMALFNRTVSMICDNAKVTRFAKLVSVPVLMLTLLLCVAVVFNNALIIISGL